MNDQKVKECILFMLCRAGIYPFHYESPLLIFFEKLMKKDKLDLNIPCCGNELFEYIDPIIKEMECTNAEFYTPDNEIIYIPLRDGDIRKHILNNNDIVYTPLRDYDSKILSKDEVSILEGILSDMIKESRRIYENSPDPYICVDSYN